MGVTMRLSELLQESNYTVVLTGAGLSSECGLKDLSQKAAELYEQSYAAGLEVSSSGDYYKKACEEFFKHCLVKIESCRESEAHKILAKWEAEGNLKCIITENIDCFHQKAGSRNVIELHGSIADASCTICGKEVKGINLSCIHEKHCNCGGAMRPSITLLNEALPIEALEKAHEEIERAELLVVIGSKADTAPASVLAYYLKPTSKIVVVNSQKTTIDSRAQLVVRGKIQDILNETEKELQSAC